MATVSPEQFKSGLKNLTVILREDLSQDYLKIMLRHSYDNCKINHTGTVSQVENLRQACD